MRTLILLYAYKAYPKEETFSPHFVPTPLPLNEETYYGNSIWGDCYITIAKRWLEAGFVDAVKGIAIQYPKGHPRYSPAGVMQIADGFDFYILEDISQYASIHTAAPSDILWVRGEPPWEPILEQHNGSYRLYYNGATTGKWRPRYPVDAILVDDPSRTVPGIKCVEFFKCCDEEVFRPLGLKKTYDICFIATFARGDKKGQLEFAKLANKKWTVIFAGEPADADVVRELKRLWPSCEVVEQATKTEVNEILNRSKVSVINSKAHDACPRVIVESMAAGTPVIINKRNIGRKYVTPQAGLAVPTWLFRWALGWMLWRHDRFDAAGEYERRYHSRVVAETLWGHLCLSMDQAGRISFGNEYR